jgi:hypothetical protein
MLADDATPLNPEAYMLHVLGVGAGIVNFADYGL